MIAESVSEKKGKVLAFPKKGATKIVPYEEEPTRGDLDDKQWTAALAHWVKFSGVSVKVLMLERPLVRSLRHRLGALLAEQRLYGKDDKPEPENLQERWVAFFSEVVAAAVAGVPGVLVGESDLGSMSGAALAELLDQAELLGKVGMIALRTQAPDPETRDFFE